MDDVTDDARTGGAATAGPETPGIEALVRLAARVQGRCERDGITLATAESCTGGLLGHVITENPGSSAYYVGGAVTYADRIKSGLVDVPEATLRAHGAVSAQVAAAMAEGARRRFGADLAVAVTGIAGPDGGSDAKPVGLTYVATAGKGSTAVRRFTWHGDRSANKRESAAAALRLLLEALGEGPDA